MDTLKNKIDFVALVSVSMANSNGDPLNGNRPRTDYDGFGEISDVCIKRKIRNRMQDLGQSIFVQSSDRCDDGCKSLSDRPKRPWKRLRMRRNMPAWPVRSGWMYAALDRFSHSNLLRRAVFP